jgi:histone H3/H4
MGIQHKKQKARNNAEPLQKAARRMGSRTAVIKYPGNEAMRRCIKRAGISRISKNASEYVKSVLEKVTARVLHSALEETIYNRKTTVSDKAIMRSLERLGEGLHM